VNTVNKHSKQSDTTASKQMNSESTPKVTKTQEKDKIVENNQTQKDGSKINRSLYESHKERISQHCSYPVNIS